MKRISNRIVLAAIMLSVGFLFALVTVSGVQAQEQLEQEEQSQEEAPQENNQETQDNTDNQASEDAYVYTAQPGDSYTLMARKAVQTYGINNSVDLSEAQIIYTETNLTQAAGSPLLNVGQEVTIEDQMVAEWVEKAQALSEEDQAVWAQYAVGADFNTDAVGQAS